MGFVSPALADPDAPSTCPAVIGCLEALPLGLPKLTPGKTIGAQIAKLSSSGSLLAGISQTVSSVSISCLPQCFGRFIALLCVQQIDLSFHLSFWLSFPRQTGTFFVGVAHFYPGTWHMLWAYSEPSSTVLGVRAAL